MSKITGLLAKLEEALLCLQEQQFSSAATSLNQVPRALTLLDREGVWNDVTSALDLGAGKYDASKNYLSARNVSLFRYDPYNLPDEVNTAALASGKHEIVLLSNVLNVIKEKSARDDLIKLAKQHVSPTGQLVVQVYSGTNDGKPKRTGIDQYQLNQPLAYYASEIKKHFNKVDLTGGIIRAQLN